MADDKNALDHIQLAYEEVEPCVRKVRVSVLGAAVDREMKGALGEFVRGAQLPGFRRGRAPESLLKRRFGKRIEEESERKIRQDVFRKILEEKKIDIVSFPPPESIEFALKPGEDCSFELEFNVAPEFELPEYKGVKIDAEPVEISDGDVEEQLGEYRNAFAEYKTVDASAERGDMLKVSYTSDFEPPEDAPETVKNLAGSEENWIWLNEPEIIPGTMEAMVGTEAGKEVEVVSTYPEKHREAALAGKTVTYKIKVKEVQRKAPLGSDEELVERMRLENMDQLKERIRTNLTARREQERQAALRERAVEAVVGKVSDFPLPPRILEGETARQLRDMISRIVQDREAAEKFEKDKEARKAEAERLASDRLKRFFVFRNIAEKESIEVGENEIDAQIKGMSRQYGYKEQELRQMMASSGGDDELRADLLMRKVTDFILENAAGDEAAGDGGKGKGGSKAGKTGDSKAAKTKKPAK